MPLARIAAIVLTLGITAAHAQSAALTDEEAAIVARAFTLTRMGGTEKTLILPVETANFQCTGDSGVKLGGCSGAMRTSKLTSDEVIGWLSKELAAVASPELITDFKSKAQNSARVGKVLPLEMKQIIGEPPANDEAGRPYLLLDFSRVSFNPAKTEALVYIATVSQVDPRRSFGEFLCFRLDDNVWKLAGRAKNWALKQ
jgi:hypothetical protein